MQYQYKKDLNKNIFREYDIRGVYPTELDDNTAYTFGLGFGTHIQKLGKKKCVVGHDNRLSSPALYAALIEGIKSTGVDVMSLGLCTTPMFYYACIHLEIPSGVMVTASHNPKDDNGLKFSFDESGCCKGDDISNFLQELLVGEFNSGTGKVFPYNIEKDYISLYESNLHFGTRRLKVVLDPGNGTTADFCRKIYEKFPIELIVINGESDGSFPNHHPDPSIESNLEQLKTKVLEVGAHVGIAFDGDGDRLGVVSNTGQYIPSDILMIIIIRDIVNKVKKKQFLYDVKCSKTLSDEIERLGAEGICYRTGHSYMRAKVSDDDMPFGGELSGHIYFRDRWPGFDSGMYAGARLLEIMSHTEKNINQLLEGINQYYSTPEIKIPSTDVKKVEVVNKIKEYVISCGYSFLDVDGVRINFEDGWALIRYSNTGPNITARFEAVSEDRLQKIQQEFLELVNAYNI